VAVCVLVVASITNTNKTNQTKPFSIYKILDDRGTKAEQMVGFGEWTDGSLAVYLVFEMEMDEFSLIFVLTFWCSCS